MKKFIEVCCLVMDVDLSAERLKNNDSLDFSYLAVA